MDAFEAICLVLYAPSSTLLGTSSTLDAIDAIGRIYAFRTQPTILMNYQNYSEWAVRAGALDKVGCKLTNVWFKERRNWLAAHTSNFGAREGWYFICKLGLYILNLRA